jgi:phage shock protein A
VGERLRRVANILGGRADAVIDRIESPDDVVRRIVTEAHNNSLEIQRRTQDVIARREEIRAHMEHFSRSAEQSLKASKVLIERNQMEAAQEAYSAYQEAQEASEDLASEFQRLTLIAEQLKTEVIRAKRDEERVRTNATVAVAKQQSAKALRAAAAASWGDAKSKGPSVPELLGGMERKASEQLAQAQAIREIGEATASTSYDAAVGKIGAEAGFAALVAEVQSRRELGDGSAAEIEEGPPQEAASTEVTDSATATETG